MQTTLSCRDALAVLRRQYGLEASPRKKNHRNHDLKAQDAPALEQVSDCCDCFNHMLQSKDGNAMQIIVGVLLFTPLLFLLPTTAVYYMLALLLHTAVLVTCWGLEILDQLCQTIPLHTLWCWAVKPGMLPGEHPGACFMDVALVMSMAQMCSCNIPKINVSIHCRHTDVCCSA